MITVNVNVLCRVKLTPFGEEVIRKKTAWRFDTPDWNAKEHILTTQLWDLMVLFGDGIGMCSPIPFDKNRIEIFEESL